MVGLKARLAGLFVGALCLPITRLIVDVASLSPGLAGFGAVESGHAGTASAARFYRREREMALPAVALGWGGAAAPGKGEDSWVVLTSGGAAET